MKIRRNILVLTIPLINTSPQTKDLGMFQRWNLENREAYKKAWKAEYKNVMKSLKKKCVYAEDKRNINSLEKNIEQQIKVEKKVLKTELTEAYEINPDPSKVKNDFSRISLLGHGTRERLSQSEGEIYRDVCVRILNIYSGDYKFKFYAPKNEE